MDQRSFDLNDDKPHEIFKKLPKEQQHEVMQLMACLIVAVFQLPKDKDHDDPQCE